MFDVHRICMQICAIIRDYFAIIRDYCDYSRFFLHDSHLHRSEIGTEYLIRIRIVQKFSSPNIPSVDVRLASH